MDAVRQDQQPDSDLQTASAPTDKANVAATAVVAVASQPPALVAEQPTLPQIAEPPVDPSSENRIARSVPTIAYRVTPPRVQIVSGTAARSPERPAGASKSNVVLLAGAAAGLLFAGGIFHVTRHLSRRTHKQLVPATNGVIGTLDITSPVASRQPSITSDPLDDVTRTLLERDLEPALQACNFPWSHHNTGGSSGAISLPPAAAWLTRPKAA
jgi:hypothetical protein